ncbi:hypothetical protein HJG54_33345 [Leptolyngbya sp. NK1-12]|uniref:Uncharacterized protein n=1 Tax=Leptolyngbya sp. NK1-12 TaxID=2547451 RepID=A0AA96WLB6_9CYAN|nr:hypothetical protein [Leptolyngbya sp. NK1-12]WNZ27728.1 hypothetical protein HJG54_33345 [Leptolyngbya sp. NK1-12]
MRFGLDWLALPLLGLLFWAGSSLIGQQLLNRPNPTAPALQVEPQPSPTEQVLSIKVAIDRDRGVSQVSVRAVTSVIKQQTFEISATDARQLEAVIAQQLKLSPQQVKALIRYQVK